MGVVVAVITMVGGFTAVAYTDSLQTSIMILGWADGAGWPGKTGGWHGLVYAPATAIAKP
jgi:hypothetical protein